MTCALERRGDYTDEYKKTIGVDFLEKQQYVESLGEDVKLMVWDTAGQEEFDSITRTYYRGENCRLAQDVQPVPRMQHTSFACMTSHL